MIFSDIYKCGKVEWGNTFGVINTYDGTISEAGPNALYGSISALNGHLKHIISNSINCHQINATDATEKFNVIIELKQNDWFNTFLDIKWNDQYFPWIPISVLFTILTH